MTSFKDSKKKVLLVEDDEDLQMSYLTRLQVLGFEVTLAKDGQGALDLVTKETFDLILLDMLIPRINGFKVCSQMKSFENSKNIPIIVISALAEPVFHKQAIECGADAFFVKPFDWEALHAKIKTLLKLS